MNITKIYQVNLVLILISIFLSWRAYSQELPHPVVNTGVYEFLDELASMQVIEINSAVKPYSRLYIANKLNEADQQRKGLNSRQHKELDFYLLDFGKELSIKNTNLQHKDLQDRTT